MRDSPPFYAQIAARREWSGKTIGDRRLTHLPDLFSNLVAVVAIVCLAAPAAAQLSGTSVSEDSGPLSEISTNVRTGSRPVHESGRSVRDSSAGPISGASAGESSVSTVRSGTFSDISAGTVASDRSVRREKLPSRLIPAPPRLAPKRTVPEPIDWEPVDQLDSLIEALASIEPLERTEGQEEPNPSVPP